MSPSLYVGLVCIRIYIYTHMSFTFICMDVLRIARYRNMLLCDGCDDGWHMYCLPIKLTEVPEDDWFCMDCAVDFADATVEYESESEFESGT